MKLHLLVFLVVWEFGLSAVPRKLLVSVYYESKCPDSRKFIINQLLPTIEQLHEYVDLELVPFGKAQSVNNGYGGFECQHGLTECRGNMMQDCALNLMRGSTDVEKVVYVTCEMHTLFGTKGMMQCAQNSNIPLTLLHRCVTSDQGIELQLHSEALTNRVDHKFIPTITINKVFNQQIQDQSQKNLMGTLCSILNDVPPCAKLYNNLALHHVLF